MIGFIEFYYNSIFINMLSSFLSLKIMIFVGQGPVAATGRMTNGHKMSMAA